MPCPALNCRPTGTVAFGFISVRMTRPDLVSAKDVVEGNVAPERFAGKLVLVGTSAIGLLDVKTTPVLSAMPGVEVHAQLLEAALTNSLLVAPSYAIVVEMIGALIGGGVLALLAPAASVLMLFASAALAAAAFVAASWILFSRYQMLFDATFLSSPPCRCT